MSELVFNQAALTALFEGEGMAKELERVAERVVVATKEALGTPATRHDRNPAPGPPRMRSGDLLASVHHTEARIVDGVLTVFCIADAVHRGWYYDQILRDKGYVLVDLDSVRA